MLIMSQRGVPATPSAGNGLGFFDSSNGEWSQKKPNGLYSMDWCKANTAQIAAHSADTYYLGLQLPSFSMQAGMFVMWEFHATKGAAGVAAPAYNIRIGATGTIADTARLTLNGPAQTAAADTGFWKIFITVRSVGVAGIIYGMELLQHNLAVTGFANAGPAGLQLAQGAGAAFDNSALAGQFIGLSVNPGAAGAWVVDQAFVRAWC